MLWNEIGRYGFRFFRFWLRFAIIRAIFSWWLSNMSDYLPLNKISETDTLLCFHHPQPSHALHILLVPKKEVQNLSQLDLNEDDFLLDLFTTVRSLIDEFGLDDKGYRLVVNGGDYQEFPQLHFHLISDG
jgi:histidine triad (HIT) family protein